MLKKTFKRGTYLAIALVGFVLAILGLNALDRNVGEISDNPVGSVLNKASADNPDEGRNFWDFGGGDGGDGDP